MSSVKIFNRWQAQLRRFRPARRHEGRGNLHTQVAGGLIGLDKYFDADRMIGTRVGGGTTDFTVDGRSSRGHARSVQVGVYGHRSFDPAYVSAVAAYGNVSTAVQRLGLGDAAVVGLDEKLALTSNVALLGNFSGRFSGLPTTAGGFGGLRVTW